MENFLTKAEVAKWLHTHPTTIVRMVADGRLPQPIRLNNRQNGKVLFVKSELEAALLARRNPGDGQ